MAKLIDQLPRKVAKRVMRRAATSNEPIVITVRNGKPSQVYGLASYQKQRELPRRVKPWLHRATSKPGADPLGAVDASPPSPLTRESMYAE